VTKEDVDLMHRSDGEEVVDSTYDIDVIPRASFACVLHPSEPGRAYFFCANRYVLIDVAPASASTADVSNIVEERATIARGWPSLIVDAGFSSVDAVLPVPGSPSEMYFFCGRRYTRLSSVQNGSPSQYVAKGTQDIATGWPSLHSAGFQMVDAVLPNPANNDEAYFFSGEQYAIINVKQRDLLGGPRSIQEDWASLRQAGFTMVDAALLDPDNPNEAFIFLGERYVRVNVQQGVAHDQLVDSPRLIRDNWPALHRAGFW